MHQFLPHSAAFLLHMAKVVPANCKVRTLCIMGAVYTCTYIAKFKASIFPYPVCVYVYVRACMCVDVHASYLCAHPCR